MSNPVILANGTFPTHPIPVAALRNATPLVCCDGAVNKLLAAGMAPDVIIGDLDSMGPDIRSRFGDRLIEVADQETNDLTKAIRWCQEQDMRAVTILGATGEREDHTLANLALLATYARDMSVEMITDFGTFSVVREPRTFPCHPGQQISIFSLTPETGITSAGLKYPLNSLKLMEFWQGSLNEATGDSFSLTFSQGTLLVYRVFGEALEDVQ